MSLCTYWKTRVFNSVFSAAYNRTPKYMSKVKIIFVFNCFCVKLNKVTLWGKNVGVKKKKREKKRKDPISCSTHHSWTRPEEQQLREWARHVLRLGSENSIQIIPRPPKQRACATWLCREIIPVKAVNRIDVKGQDPPGVSLTHFCSVN